MAVSYHTEDCRFAVRERRALAAWLRSIATAEGGTLGDVSLVFCSDAYLLGINRQYLNHDYFTDVITFDYSGDGVVSGDIFISVDTVRSNAEGLGEMFHVELSRVISHGILHLCGYGDKTRSETKTMRERENHYMDKLPEGLALKAFGA